jgi:hypothetical protein
MFSESEINFLMQKHVETAAGNRTLKPVQDLREMGCPLPIFNRILEDRARKLGNKFAEFRSSNKPSTLADAPLDSQIEAVKLW